jgi:hypothetical protein
MPFPIQNPNYVTLGLSRFTSRFSGTAAPNVQALAMAWLTEFQGIENAAFGVIYGRLLKYAVGETLDELGDLVGQLRGGLPDNQYRIAIGLKILANASSGTPEDLLEIALIAAKNFTNDNNGQVGYQEAPVMSWQLEIYNLTYPSVLWPLLNEARAIASRGNFIWSTWPNDLDDIPGSVYDAALGQLGPGSVYNAALGGLTVTCVQLLTQ